MDTEKKDIKTPRKRATIGEVNCNQLFMREFPYKDADIIHILTFKEPVVIDEKGSTDDFYKITTGSLIGYCVKEYITVK